MQPHLKELITSANTKNVLSKEVANDMGLYRKAMLCAVFCASVAAGSVEAADGANSGMVIDRVVDISSTGVMPLPENLDVNDVREAVNGVNLDSFDILGAEERLTFGVAVTKHVGLDLDYNEIHPHIRYENGSFATGVYYNSESNISVYGAAIFDVTERASVELGVVSGYASTDVLPFAKINYELNDNLKAFVAPCVEVINDDLKVGGVAGVEVKFDLFK